VILQYIGPTVPITFISLGVFVGMLDLPNVEPKAPAAAEVEELISHGVDRWGGIWVIHSHPTKGTELGSVSVRSDGLVAKWADRLFHVLTSRSLPHSGPYPYPSVGYGERECRPQGIVQLIVGPVTSTTDRMAMLDILVKG
jgi:hypothetical protein